MNTPTHADDLERIVRILADAPADGLSLDDIQKKSGEYPTFGDHWSLRQINILLCDLGNRVTFKKIRTPVGKETRYELRRPE